MSKFEPMRIKSGTIFAKENTRPQEIFFLLKGCVECDKSNKFYLEGTMFGETDIIYKRKRFENYIAKCDCYILKVEKDVFEQIMDEFEDFDR
jgi:CRP-like cAMP-binding protein